MSYASGDGNLSKFLELAPKILSQAHGVNEQSLPRLADLAMRLQLSAEELEAAAAQLGLGSAEVARLRADARLDSEAGGGGAALTWVLVLGSLAVLLGVGGGAAYFLMNQPKDSAG